MPSDNAAVQRGYANEFVVAAHLMRNGYEVYLAVGSTSCDMVAMTTVEAHDRLQEFPARITIRVEVKTLGKPNGLGKYWVRANREDFDMLVCVTQDGEVWVDPPESLVGVHPRVPSNRA